jgi:AcrR family transcriptional regulator
MTMSRRGASGREPPAGRSARQRIVAGARRHFFAHGFRGVTVDDLAAELGMSKKTLYAHFPSKPAIVEAAILDKFGDLSAELERITTECSADFVGALHQLLACVLRHTEEIQPPFLRDVRRDSPDLFKLIETRRAFLIQRYFGRLFAAGRRARMIRKDVPTALLVEVLLAAIQAVMTPQKMAELGLTPTGGFSAIISVILEGVLTDTGRAER